MDYSVRCADVSTRYLARCPSTGISGFTIASEATIAEAPVSVLMRFPFCVVTGTGRDGKCREYTVISSEDIIAWLVQSFDAGVFHATAYPAITFEQAWKIMKRLSDSTTALYEEYIKGRGKRRKRFEGIKI